MAVDLPEVHAAALDVTRGFVAGVGPTSGTTRHPCEDWDVRPS